jgi:hypothetical protein
MQNSCLKNYALSQPLSVLALHYAYIDHYILVIRLLLLWQRSIIHLQIYVRLTMIDCYFIREIISFYDCYLYVI